MDCQRTPPFHYHIHEHTKSLLALQELQQEVGALLEFRDVVMDTFPNLRQKLEPTRTPQWEPGVKVKRKIVPKTADGISGVQDSGFSTETNSSNKNEAEDELWNLLDVIETKGTKLREEFEALKKEHWVTECPRYPPRRCRSLDSIPDPPAPFPLELQDLEILLDKLTLLETENVASRVRTSELQSEMSALISAKEELEEQLQVVLGQKGELNRCVQQLLKGEVPSSQEKEAKLLGALDGLLTDPRRTETYGKAIKPDRRKLVAILNAKHPLELRKHLIFSVVENQALNQSLESSIIEKEGLAQQLEKSKEENEELKFRLEERAIELEGTKARVRVLERLQKPKKEENNFIFLEGDNLRSKGFSDFEISRAKEIFETNHVLPILALPLPGMSESESIDTAQKSPRRRPSRIPLSSPALRKSLGDLQKDLALSSPKPPSTTTVTMTFKKVSSCPSNPSLKPATNFSTVRARDTLTRRSQSHDSNRSLRSQSESGRSLRSRDSLTSVRRDPTPTKMGPPSKTSASKPNPPESVKVQNTSVDGKSPKTPFTRRRRVLKSPPPSTQLSNYEDEPVAPKTSPLNTERPGIVKEARRSFHRRLAEKLALNLNLSGVRQLLRDGSTTGFGVWSSPKQVTEPPPGEVETHYFDSIDNTVRLHDQSSIIQSCSFMASPDSLEPSRRH